MTLESNQAWVAPAELQSAAAPCSTSPDAGREIQKGAGGVKREFAEKLPSGSELAKRGHSAQVGAKGDPR